MLSEGDDPQDPIADAARGILDGHIVLSRELAEAGHYPAIDIETLGLARDDQRRLARATSTRRGASASCYARHHKARDLIQLGAYAPGHDAELDAGGAPARARWTALLQQDMNEPAPPRRQPGDAARRAGRLIPSRMHRRED